MQAPQDTAPQAKAPPAKGRGADEHDHSFDRGHAGLQLGVNARRTEDEQFFDGVHTVTGVGTSLGEKYNKAKEAKNAAQVIAIARDMSTVERQSEIAPDLDDLAGFMSAREVALVGGLSNVAAEDVVLAMLKASPHANVTEVRAFFAELGIFRMTETFNSPVLVPALRARFSTMSPVDLVPGLGDSGALYSTLLAEWFIDTTAPRIVAHVLLAIKQGSVAWQAGTLNKIG